MKPIRKQPKEKLYSEATAFQTYLNGIIHEGLKTLTALGYTLVPIFFLLDFFTMPTELLPRFGIYRLISTLLVLFQYFIIRYTKPSNLSYFHGYFISINVGGIISLMTVDLGGFNSSYYAGLNLVIIAVNLLLSWEAIHSAINSIIIISVYIILNFVAAKDFAHTSLINNCFFLCATAIIAGSINHVKHKLVKQEFFLRVELRKARDALWSEMELAKRIQTALLPDKEKIKGFEIAATMSPAEEVGGDYYDIIETPKGDKWVTIGDVSGHGVDSGLLMMMAQTSILSILNDRNNCKPSEVLNSVNTVIRENISRMGSDHYMAMTAIRFNDTQIKIAGKHQDIIIYRAASNKTETISTQGTWLGITDDIKDYLVDTSTTLDTGDIVLLFTDGITEATNLKNEMYGQKRLEQCLNQYANLPVGKLIKKIIKDVISFQEQQLDDITLLAIKKISQA
jgi:serine phosphatase RsbU (regulator of sigma subunit)